MSDELPNLDILIKCMKMTLHDNDNQALVAIRTANKQLLKFGGDWETLLRGKVKIIGDPFAGVAAPQPRTPTSYDHKPAPPRKPAPTPPPRAQWTPPPQTQYPPPPRTPYSSTPPPKPSSPAHGQTRTNMSGGTCIHCKTPVRAYDGREVYSSLMGIWELQHNANACPVRNNERINKYAGKCVKCSQRVEIAQGLTYHNGVRWMTEHNKGSCPSPDSRRRKQPLTSDDLMS